jgi:hypothetical protein
VLRLKRDGLLGSGGADIARARVLRIGGAGDGGAGGSSSGSSGSSSGGTCASVEEAGWEAQVDARVRDSPALATLQVDACVCTGVGPLDVCV